MTKAENVKRIIAQRLNVSQEEVTLETNLQDDLGADSLDLVEVIMALEEEFNIEIPDQDAEAILTVGQAVEYIDKKVPQ